MDIPVELGFGPFCCVGGIRGYGNAKSKIVFVGIEPAFNEMQTGKPLVGASGSLLNDVLTSFGWKREWVYCTNLCCTWFDPPTQENINTCHPRLIDELKLIQPVFVIALGKLACQELFGREISKTRGFILRDVLGIPGCYGMATWHPSAILQSGDKPEEQNNLSAELVRDLKKIRLFYRNDDRPRLAVPSPVGLSPIIHNTVESAQAVLNGLPRDEIVTLDIETPIIDKDDREADPYHQILCVGIGLAGDIQHVFPEELLDKLNFPKDVQWGGWNLYGFDKVALKVRYNIDIPVRHDGMLSSYVRDERTKYGTHKLKHNAREFAGADFWEENNVRANFETLARYNGLDVAYNHRLLRFHTRSFDSDDSKLYYDLLIPAANLLSEAQYNGCTIDKWQLMSMSLLMWGETQELQQEIVELAKSYGFPGEINPASTVQTAHLLFDILGIDPEQYSHRTKGGKWSVDKNVLDAINHPWANLVRRFNNVTDTSSRYISNPLRQVKFDGKVHPKAWIPGAATGRLSYSDPPVHQLPHARTVGELSKVRSIFTVDSDDYVLVEADYQQIELWIMFAFSGDRNLYADLTEPWPVSGKPDYHSRTCTHGVPCLEHKYKMVTSCPVCVKWAFDRDNQKHVNFGIPYGETAHGLMRPPPIGTGLSFTENQKLIDKWHKRNPDFMQWVKSIEYIIRTQGVIKTPFGRKRRIPIVLNNKQIRQAANAPIQSVASDYTLSAAIELKPILDQYDTRLLWLTHDAGLWHVPVKHLDKVENLIREIMEKPRIPGFPSVKVDIKHGKNLYEVSP